MKEQESLDIAAHKGLKLVSSEEISESRLLLPSAAVAATFLSVVVALVSGVTAAVLFRRTRQAF